MRALVSASCVLCSSASSTGDVFPTDARGVIVRARLFRLCSEGRPEGHRRRSLGILARQSLSAAAADNWSGVAWRSVCFSEHFRNFFFYFFTKAV